ncbi:uncharacterized protein C8Q71DRAFT_863591 [Rhodofomes roseus]|uniref:Uncharacterized protein n=1 Tax=Rhodofomes roseus TaxID=34475 RepID=A0ABQ8JXV3_9APHY|nr:uncharacterized protein C8Q71DRAFT_863591 [Rhodofomes roseus]KAH9829039.1 hypothetical protein C8Q71DRAFT_863591 [Rhodofomes roseus]
MTSLQRSIAHVHRRSAAGARRRTACQMRPLSAPALAHEGHAFSELSLLLTPALAQTGSAQKPSLHASLARRNADPLHLRSTPHTVPPVAFSSSSPNQAPEDDYEPEHNGDGEISDQEWEIRTGRAVYILQQTLPDFFHTGLVTSLEAPPARARTPDADPHCEGRAARPDGEGESIYSRHIRLAYTPPHPLPPPLPRTLTIEGSALYLASSAFVRHTLNALYTDLTVRTTRVRVLGPRSSPGSPDQDGPPRAPHKQRSSREKSLFLGLSVSGIARVSGQRGGWDVCVPLPLPLLPPPSTPTADQGRRNSTYTFSPRTGLIYLHHIDSIEPAPTQAVFDALRAALAKLGLAPGGGEQAPGAPGAARAQPVPVPVHVRARSS